MVFFYTLHFLIRFLFSSKVHPRLIAHVTDAFYRWIDRFSWLINNFHFWNILPLKWKHSWCDSPWKRLSEGFKNYFPSFSSVCVVQWISRFSWWIKNFHSWITDHFQTPADVLCMLWRKVTTFQGTKIISFICFDWGPTNFLIDVFVNLQEESRFPDPLPMSGAEPV